MKPLIYFLFATIDPKSRIVIQCSYQDWTHRNRPVAIVIWPFSAP